MPTAPARRRLVFLVGAHKTASSHLQQSLLDAAPALTARGVAILPPKVIRADLTPVSALVRDGISPEIGQGAGAAFLSLHGGPAPTVVLMDENILGSTDRKMLMRKTRLYPWAHHRLGRIISLFPGHDIEIGLAIRSPATFLPSCWSESLHHGPYEPFRRFIKGVDPLAFSWSALADRLHDAAPHARIIAWRYEDYPQVFPHLTARLLGPDAGPQVSPVDRIMRPGLSAKAAQWLGQQQTPDKDTVLAARKRFPKQENAPGLDPWTASDHAAMATAYADDTAALTTLPYVHLVTPDSPPAIPSDA
ncbi:hypothetical protein [Roseovarius sp.]|uniref:hypothetical protein n=1 Tax=Roseovarius sp. TaxID=1486281 RepID=UPI00262F5663|nr:hypothetical protein [Roseovarius sp.]MDM8165508.1 hypothetical protein [Roseovarius sp.]